MNIITRLLRNLKTPEVAWNCEINNNFEEKVQIVKLIQENINDIHNSNLWGVYEMLSVQDIKINFINTEKGSMFRMQGDLLESKISILLDSRFKAISFSCTIGDMEICKLLVQEYFEITKRRLIQEKEDRDCKREAILNTLKGV